MSAKNFLADDSITLIKEFGEQLYESACAKCHAGNKPTKIPGLNTLRLMTGQAIFNSLRSGKMQSQAKQLSKDECLAIVHWITGQPLEISEVPVYQLTSFDLSYEKAVINSTGWGNNLEGTGFTNKQLAGITPENIGSLKLKWSFAFPEATQVRCKPSIVGDWLIVGSQPGDVFALQKSTGQIGWHFKADAAIRGAIYSVRENNNVTAYFADYATNVYALNVLTGKLLWKERSGMHPESVNTGSVIAYNDIVYIPLSSNEVVSAANPDYSCCTSSGEVVALNAKTGKEIWRYRVIVEEPKIGIKKKDGNHFYGPSGAPVWCSPTVDVKRGLLYIGTGENYSFPLTTTSDAIQAIDLATGKLRWSYQATEHDVWNLACPDNSNCPTPSGNDLDFGMAPILVKQEKGDILVAGQKSGIVYALNPNNGKIRWQKRIGKGGGLGGIHWGMATDGENVYAANSDHALALDKRAVNYPASPGIFALDINNGSIIWKSIAKPCEESIEGCFASNSAAPVVVPGIVFAGSLDGHIRAYSTEDGRILWDYNTVIEFKPINDFKGYGGAIDGPGPVVSEGMLFVNSGYGVFRQMPGNVLLAFEVN